MAYSQAQGRATAKYTKEHYKRYTVQLTKEVAEQFQAIVNEKGKSVNSVFADFVLEYIEQNKD